MGKTKDILGEVPGDAVCSWEGSSVLQWDHRGQRYYSPVFLDPEVKNPPNIGDLPAFSDWVQLHRKSINVEETLLRKSVARVEDGKYRMRYFITGLVLYVQAWKER